MTEIKAIVFDLGKVIFDLSFDRVFESWANASGKQFVEIKDKFAFDETFDMFERNEISPEQFRKTISQRLDINLSDADFDAGWCNLYLDVYAGIDKVLFDLKHRYTLVALTNTNAIHYKVWTVKYAEILKHFETVFSSQEMGMRKPERKIFETVLDYLNINPEQTLFLDDNKDNIEGAQKIGIHALLVTSPEQMFAELKEMHLI